MASKSQAEIENYAFFLPSGPIKISFFMRINNGRFTMLSAKALSQGILANTDSYSLTTFWD